LPANSFTDERVIIPRWRSSTATASMGELASLNAPLHRDDAREQELLAEKRHEWERRRSLAFASDLVGAALLARDSEIARDAAEFVLLEPRVSEALQSAAHRVLGHAEPQLVVVPDELLKSRARDEIRMHKARLRIEANDPLRWADQALAYSILGQMRQAQRSMAIARHLAPENRFVVRSAVRLAIHHKEPDRGHDLLLRLSRTRHDPWLVAAEIAAASVAGRTSRLTKAARSLSELGRFSPFALSEMRGALATLEFESGAAKLARRLFTSSLENPTENAVAQGRWAATMLPQLSSAVAEHAQLSAEARAWMCTAKRDWEAALTNCWAWLADEPFSSRPCVYASYLSAVAVDDPVAAAQFAEAGQRANPAEFNLLNNLCVALASQGRVDEARNHLEILSRIAHSEEHRMVLAATKGLVLYRSGTVDDGRRMYLEAIESARKADPTRAALALLFMAREEMACTQKPMLAIVDAALDQSRAITDPPIAAMRDRLQSRRSQLA